VRTTYGRPALQALARTVAAAKAEDVLAPVTVVVPSNHVGVTARRSLAVGRGTIAVTFLTPSRLAELLGAPGLAATGRRPVSTPVVAAALRQALREDPGVFGAVADHPATEEALVGVFAELFDVSTAGRRRVAAAGARAADVVRLCEQARARLAPRWYDESDLVEAARAALESPETSPDDLGTVILYLPQDLTQRAAALVRDVVDRFPTVVVVARTGNLRADTGVERSIHRLGLTEGTDPTVSPPLEPGRQSQGWPVSADSTRILTTSDPDDEVRTAVRVVLDATRDGVPLERIGVLFPTERPYARLLHEHLTAADIPVNGTSADGLRSSVLGRTLLELLALRRHRYRRRAVVGLLAGTPLRAVDGGDPPPTTDWERLSREAAVVAGRDHWDRRLDQLADELDQRAESHEAEPQTDAPDTEPDEPTEDERVPAAGPADLQDEHPPASRPDLQDEHPPADPADLQDERQAELAAWYRRRAERARSLRRLVLGIIDQLEQAAASTAGWRQRVGWLRRLAAGLLGAEAVRQRWPTSERKAAERVEAALDRLVTLDEVEGPVTLDVFHRTLELELDADLGRVGRFGEGLLVAPLSFAVGIDLDLLVVVGLAEGILPSAPGDDSLLPDRERLLTQGELRLSRELPDRQQRQLRAGLAAAQRHVLCAPRGDLRASNEHVRSRWLAEMTAERPPSQTDGLDGRIMVEEVPSFAHGVTHAVFPATAQEYRLRAPRVALADPVVAAGTAMRRGRRSDQLTRFDGNLSGQPLPSPHDDVVSATRLESWAVCPHAYFVRHILRVHPTEDPAEALWISPLDRGSLVHEILERFLGAVLARAPDEQPGPDQSWSAIDRELLHRIAAELFADYEARGVVGRALFWSRDRARILARLDRLLEEDAARRRATRSRPIAAELAFGFPEAPLPEIEMRLPDDRLLRFRGAADRIDITDEGALRVIDYKTGRPDEYRRLSEQNPDDGGTHLQLAVYGMAARAFRKGFADAPVVAEYWFVGDSPGLIHIGYQVTDEVLEAVGATLATIVDGIERGTFPARPPANSGDPFVRCPYCNPDGIDTTDLRRAWERKRHDPQVAAYAELAEPVANP
jgi:ATP-dependent helicase/nuclease subunit B